MKQRIIKFRVWNKPTQQMTYLPDIMKWAYIMKGISPLSSSLGDERNWEKEHNIFLQYTGLKDKNGKEIYEGDIVNYDRDSFQGGPNSLVEWSGSGFYIAKHIPLLVRKFNTDIEVIGNIYENPELLKK